MANHFAINFRTPMQLLETNPFIFRMSLFNATRSADNFVIQFRQHATIGSKGCRFGFLCVYQLECIDHELRFWFGPQGTTAGIGRKFTVQVAREAVTLCADPSPFKDIFKLNVGGSNASL